MEILPGGYVSQVVRIGDTVRRSVPEHADFVHALLRHLEPWGNAPRFLGVDDEGREVLTYIDGESSVKPSEEGLGRVAQLVREFHDLTTDLADGEEVVCHNDLSPKNTIYRDDRPVAFIDWDIAAPGARIHDIAHMCWQYVDFGPDAGRHMRLMCDAYRLEDRSAVVDTILWWQDRCWRGIESKAADGDAAMIRLRDLGGADWVRADFAWVEANRKELEEALR